MPAWIGVAAFAVHVATADVLERVTAPAETVVALAVHVVTAGDAVTVVAPAETVAGFAVHEATAGLADSVIAPTTTAAAFATHVETADDAESVCGGSNASNRMRDMDHGSPDRHNSPTVTVACRRSRWRGIGS
jgi:hypothetical protein